MARSTPRHRVPEPRVVVEGVVPEGKVLLLATPLERMPRAAFEAEPQQTTMRVATSAVEVRAQVKMAAMGQPSRLVVAAADTNHPLTASSTGLAVVVDLTTMQTQ